MTSAVSPPDGRAVVLYDGACAFCRRSVRLLGRLDWRHRLRFQSARDVDHLPPTATPLDPRRLLEELHVVTPDGKRVSAGFRAFRWLAWRLPLTLPLAPLLYVPGVPWVGAKVYRWVARNRFALVPCAGGACRLTHDHRNRPPR
jgi:predicted DCC family thiol-disulfide oxidoreductase YuxK